MSDETFFSRWSRRKRASISRPDTPVADAAPESNGPPDPPAQPPVPAASKAAAPPPLPDVASLTHESDFAPFMRGDVDPKTKAQALKTLFSDPRFNVMDGLDVYIDDYSKPDPLPEGWLEKLEQVKRLGIFREPDEGAEEVAKAEQSAATPAEEAPRLERAPQAPDTAQESPITLENVRNPDPSHG